MKRNRTENEIVVALAGNPNAGKTSVFNELTGSHQHVGNWPGVTVERKEGTVKRGDVNFRVVDLPGIYSLTAYTQEEMVARDFLINHNVDVIVNVVDASSLERNLYLTTQLLELGIPTIIALNMVDTAHSIGQNVDCGKLAKLIGVDVVPTVGHRGKGNDEILARAASLADCELCEQPRSARHNPEIEIELSNLEKKLRLSVDCDVPVRWMLVKALEGDSVATERLVECSTKHETARRDIAATRKHLDAHFGNDLEAVIADGRYGFIGGLMREVVTRSAKSRRVSVTQKIDAMLLHRWLGIPIFLALMWLTFMLTFDVGGLFSGYIESGLRMLEHWVTTVMPAGPLQSLIVKGAIPGVGGVVMFVPSIMVMFVIISFLENSGYMARAAFLMDKAMHILGLHGKSFIPMLMGFGCNVPAVMATRTLETPEDRLITILITPLMSCTARLPIYALFTGIFFSRNGGMVMFGLYALGVLLAVISGKLFRKVLFPKSVSPFVMELPPYRLPTAKGTCIHVWERTALFLSKAGTVVLAASIVIWILGALPWGKSFGGPDTIIGHVGRLAEPLVRPLGLDWRAAIALFFGLGAKEIVVSTLGVLYGSGAEGVRAAFTPLTSLTFMVISLIYVPCIATIAAIRRETNSWKWTAFSVVYSITLAYLMAFGVYRIGLIMGFK